MLVSLEVRDLLIIDHLALEFGPGLNVLTGETGAGKSILLDALGFVLGWRGRADLVRAGADSGEVTAVFDLAEDHPAQAVLHEAGLSGEGGELILRRTSTRDGRKSAHINDRRASAQVLRQLSETLVELHGQQDDRGLLNPSNHRKILDDFAQTSADLAKVGELWRLVKPREKELAEMRAALEKVRAEEDFLRHALGELDQLAPEVGEDAALDARRRLMQSAGKIGEDIARAAAVLGGDGAEGAIGDALRWLESVGARAEGRLDAPLEALGRSLNELALAQEGIARAQEELTFDASELDRVEERLFAIRGLARKHGILADELPGLRDELALKITALDAGDGDLRGLEERLAEARGAYARAAERLSAKRRKAASRLDKAMMRELTPLKMERTVFETVLEVGEAGPQGIDQVSFNVATNPGAPPGALNKIASGGELSRFLLALKLCLSGGAGQVTMIFDEIDRGVGGATADAVGRRLERVAQDGQVLVVTHAPQVAARAAHHWRVEKRQRGDAVLSQVSLLDAPSRIDELARMLSGDRITDEARAAAVALLES